jgi:glycosyltransferase involved in cell wall biosynthesis
VTTPDPPAVGGTARPPASIVLATHARPAFLSDCIASIVAAMAVGDELIVMECCNPEARALLASFGPAVVHVSGPHASKTAKLNAAMRRTRAEVVPLTDDDCRVPPDWVDSMVGAFANPVVGVAFGPVHGLSSIPNSVAPVVAPGPGPPELWNYAHGASMAVRRNAVMDVGGFDERLGAGTKARGGEEADLVLRLAGRGWTCEIADTSVVQHLDWRDEQETMGNLLGYQRGGGTYLGAGLRRDVRRAAKPFLLRVRHETGIWRDGDARGRWFGPRMSIAFAGGLVRGMSFRSRQFLDREVKAAARGPRPRVLWVTDEAPDRDQGGGNIRQAMLLQSLRHRADVTLLLVGKLRDEQTRRHLDAVLELPRPRIRAPRNVTARRLHDVWRVLGRRRPSDVTNAARVRRILRPSLSRLAEDFDIVVVQHLALAPLLPTRRRSCWLLEVHNVPSERTRQELATQPGRRQRWLLAREASNAQRHERAAVASYDGVVFVSAPDQVAVAGEHSERAKGPTILIHNGVDTPSITPTAVPSEPVILLPATLDYRPNVLGAIWFCDHVLPLVQSAVPGVGFRLVGRHPVAQVEALARRPGIELHADVPDMAPWLEAARVIVVPLQLGTGTRLKALEAMAARRPVVGTSIGLEGLGIVDGIHARVVDDPAAMAHIIAELLTCDQQANALADTGRRHVEANFRWDVLADRYGDALEALARERSPR